MINNFTIKANSERNELMIKMDGFFMNSELELAFYLARKESKKLIRGFTVSFDIKNLKSSRNKNRFNLNRIQDIAKLMGAGEIKHAGHKNPMLNYTYSTVGFYQYENEWFF